MTEPTSINHKILKFETMLPMHTGFWNDNADSWVQLKALNHAMVDGRGSLEDLERKGGNVWMETFHPFLGVTCHRGYASQGAKFSHLYLFMSSSHKGITTILGPRFRRWVSSWSFGSPWTIIPVHNKAGRAGFNNCCIWCSPLEWWSPLNSWSLITIASR